EPARDLVRAQLRIALGTGAVVPAVVTGLPVLLAAAPAIAGTRLLSVPLWWAVLAFGVQPLWIAVSRWQLGAPSARNATGRGGGPSVIAPVVAAALAAPIAAAGLTVARGLHRRRSAPPSAPPSSGLLDASTRPRATTVTGLGTVTAASVWTCTRVVRSKR